MKRRRIIGKPLSERMGGTANELAERVHLLATNAKEIRATAEKVSTGDVVVVVDTRDEIGREWAQAITKKTDEELDQEVASFALARVAPTYIFSVPREDALKTLEEHAPSTSEQLSKMPEEPVVVLAIASGGTSMTTVDGLPKQEGE